MKKFALCCAISLALTTLTHADSGIIVAQAPALTSGSGTVLKDKVNVRARADKNAEIITQLNKGDAVQVLDRKGDWLRIAMPATAKCFVASKFIADGASNADAINIRSGPGTNYKDVGKLTKGDKVDVVKSEGEWTQIKPTSHCSAWIAAEFVELALPAPTPAPIQTQTIEVAPIPLAPPVAAPAPAEVQIRYVVKDGFIDIVKNEKGEDVYALMTENVGGREYIIAYLETDNSKLDRYLDKHVRVLGNQRWKRDERNSVIAVERVDIIW